MIHVIRAENLWQHAGVYYIRTQAMVKGFHIPLEAEFDKNDTPETKYILVMDERNTETKVLEKELLQRLKNGLEI